MAIFLLFVLTSFKLLVWPTSSHVSTPVSGSFLSRNNSFFLVQIFLNELSSSHFPTSEIFVKILSLESLATHHPENHKKFLTVSEFDETSLGH